MSRSRPPWSPLPGRGGALPLGQRTLVMGIVNVTPDSFSGDGLLGATSGSDTVRAAVDQVSAMVAEGADLIDVGGESTRPGHEPVDADEEARRVIAVIAGIRRAWPDLPISLDTTKAEVAEAGLRAGADILNDVAAVTSRVNLAPVAAAHSAPYVVMHSRSAPSYEDVVEDVTADLTTAVELAVEAGCSRDALIIDPGIGFGKTAEQNVHLLAGLSALQEVGVPILLGTSRKSTIGKVLDLPADDRLEGTLATTALGIASGADIVRVHDVRANVRVARVADAIVRGGWQDDQDTR